MEKSQVPVIMFETQGVRMQENTSKTVGFRGAHRVQGYVEEAAGDSTVITSGLVPQKGDSADKTEARPSEQLLKQWQADGSPEPKPEPAEEAPSDDTALPTGLALPGRDREPETPSLGFRKVLRGIGIKMQPSAAEVEAAEIGRGRSLIRLSTWPRSVGILIANPKGGVGKTPLALAVAGCLSSIRGGGTIVVEVADDAGALSVRAEGSAAVGVAELLRDMSDIHGAGQLAGYTAQQTSYAAVIGTVGDRGALSGEDVQQMAELTDTYYPIRVMDSGNQVSSSAFHGALAVTDVLVIPVLDALDALNGAMQLLRRLHQLGGHAAELARSAIVVRMHDGRPEDPEVSALADQLISTAGVATVQHVPFDAHIAERNTLSYAQLSPATTTAITGVTAWIVHQLNTELRKVSHG